MKIYGRIPHLPGSVAGQDDTNAGRSTVARFVGPSERGPRVVVTEKLDGTCVAIARRGGAIVALGRDGKRCEASRNQGRRAFAAFVAAHADRWGALREDESLVCEWLALVHTVRYDLPHEPAAVIDHFVGAVRSPWATVCARARELGLAPATLLHDGEACPLPTALAHLGEGGRHGGDRAEGVVYRLERPRDGAVLALAKYVRPGFIPGQHLPDRTGGAALWNRWRGPWTLEDLRRALDG